MRFFSYWMLPVISGTMWLATLLGLLLFWIIQEDRAIYLSMQEGQTIAYISDVGATRLKPLFVAGCIITTIFLDLAFGADRWLRHKGRLAPNTTRGEKILSGLSIGWAFLGTIGLTCLAGFDTLNYRIAHNCFLLCFILGYLLSAIFVCWEFQRLGKKYRQHPNLSRSFWIKLMFVLVEFGLAIGFGVCNFTGSYNNAAIIEWVIAFVFTFYVMSFALDLAPAVHTKNGRIFSLRPVNTLEAKEARDGPAP